MDDLEDASVWKDLNFMVLSDVFERLRSVVEAKRSLCKSRLACIDCVLIPDDVEARGEMWSSRPAHIKLATVDLFDSLVCFCVNCWFLLI